MSTANPSRPTGRSFRLVCPPEQMPQVESLLRAQGYEFEPEPFSPFCRRLLCEPRPLGSSLAAFFGYIYIQDRSSMLPPLALAPRQGEAVLDMCASPGSKTGFLGQLTGPEGFVLGNELSRARLATLRANLHACNLPHVGTCSYEGQALPLTPGTWDAIQLDPPCSGWGTVEKNPQVLKLWQGDKLKGLVGLQQLLLAHAARLLRPGGRVVFSTCTTNDDENEAQVRFAEEELGLVREHLTPFEGFVWEQRPGGEGTLRVDGERSAAQGFYVALLRKPADAPLPEIPPASAEPDARTAARNAARGRNRREEKQATCSHAEMEAIREANRALGSWRLEDCTLYVTLEPCPMCAGAILSARIPRVYYGARDRAMGACGGVLNLFMEDFPARPALVGGVLREECHQVLADFFRSLRGPNGQKRDI